MAVGNSADEARQDSAQPKSSKQVDTTTASPDAARAANEASLRPTGDVVAMVSRDSSGHPAQSENFTVLVPEDASDERKAGAWNRAGEEQGAKNLKHSGGERTIEDHMGSWDVGFSDKEQAERAKTEDRELARINYREKS